VLAFVGLLVAEVYGALDVVIAVGRRAGLTALDWITGLSAIAPQSVVALAVISTVLAPVGLLIAEVYGTLDAITAVGWRAGQTDQTIGGLYTIAPQTIITRFIVVSDANSLIGKGSYPLIKAGAPSNIGDSFSNYSEFHLAWADPILQIIIGSFIFNAFFDEEAEGIISFKVGFLIQIRRKTKLIGFLRKGEDEILSIRHGRRKPCVGDYSPALWL
jgi:hypothetical protein